MTTIFDENYFNGGNGYKTYQNWIHFAERAIWISNNLTGKLLEVGCAYGYLLEELFNINESIDIVGIDKSSYATSQALSSIASKVTTVDIKDAIIDDYDWIVSWNVLDCLDDEADAVHIASVLNAGTKNQLHILSMLEQRSKYTNLGYFIRDAVYWQNLFPNAVLVDCESKKIYNPTVFDFSQIPLHVGKGATD